MFDSCTGINIYMISVGFVLSCLAGPARGKGEVAELSQMLELQQGRKWAWILDGPAVLSAWLESELYIFRHLRKRSWLWWFPAVTLCSCSLICLMLEVFLDSWVKQDKQVFKELLQSYGQAVAGALCSQGWGLELFQERLSALSGSPSGSRGHRKPSQGSIAQFLWWKHFPFLPP